MEDIPVALFTSEGISNKNALTIAFPEDVIISEKYGVSTVQAEKDRRLNIRKCVKSKRIAFFKCILAKMGLLSFVYHLCGKGEACMNKKDLENIGLNLQDI